MVRVGCDVSKGVLLYSSSRPRAKVCGGGMLVSTVTVLVVYEYLYWSIVWGPLLLTQLCIEYL